MTTDGDEAAAADMQVVSSEAGQTSILRVHAFSGNFAHLRGRLKNGRERSPQRSCEWQANELVHEKLVNPPMVGLIRLTFSRTARRSIPALRNLQTISQTGLRKR